MLRPELRFFYRKGDAAKAVLIEDPMGGAFIETDRDTAAFARLLNGERSPAQAYERLLRDRPNAALSQLEVKPVLEELEAHGLLLGQRAGPPQGVTAARRIGPVSQRLRLGSGDRFFAWGARTLGWLYSPAMLVGWLALLGVGLATLIAQWSEFYHELQAVLSVNLVLMFWLAWIISKAWHELQHGIVARLHGVEVREFGLLFIIFLPLGAYVDITGAWRLESRWRRLHITAAGIVGELGLGSLAVLLWSWAPDGDWRAFLHALVITTMVSSIVFNANPLMRYDGYYALTDLLRVPNLYQRGAAATRDFTVRHLTGVPAREPHPPLIALYGWAALAWRLVLAATLSILAARLAFGFGLVLALAVIWGMLLVPLGRLLQTIWKIGPAARRRAALRGAMAAAGLVALWFAPIPTWISAPGVVDYRDSLQLRAGASGAVVDISVKEGVNVEKGSPVVTLANHALDTEYRRLAARHEHARIELEKARSSENPTAFQGKRELLEAVREEMGEAERRLGELDVRSPRSGIIFGGELRDLRGAWVKRGDLIGEIADLETLEVKAWLLPDDVALLKSRSARFTFRPLGFGISSLPVLLERLDPAVAIELPPASITAEGGGPLAVDASGEKRRLAETRFLSTFSPEGSTRGWYPGAPGRLISNVVWRPVNTIIRGWFDDFDLREPSRWTL
ncbi:site-2 protease family protein [Mesorhizobium sp. 1B3]|uniref:site-2 protease family protein n=1 Tax=Mesorhizobium sp. 1B3 TaxID=3243599 RepID=UPI003D9984FC